MKTNRLWTAALCFVLAFAWFGGLEHRGLFTPDEGRYAEIAREMLATGDWVTPRLNGLKYFEKPPLQYWATAASFALFGEDEWTARLPPALLGFLALLLTGFTGARLWGPRAGLLGITVLGSSWAYFLGGQYLTLDMTLAACLAGVLCSFILAHSGQASPEQRARWMLAAWACAAAAVLAKGLIGVVLPGAALAVYMVFRWRTVRIRELQILRGAAMFFAITVPWFVIVGSRNPEFFRFFFVQEHFQRFLEAGHNRPGPWWYYVPILLLGLMPWTPALLQAALRRAEPVTAAPRGFCSAGFSAAWIAAIVIFFSLSRSKLPAYILPALPALALLVGRFAARDTGNRLRLSSQAAAAFGIVFLLAIPHLRAWPKYAALGQDAADQLGWLVAAAGLMAGSGLAAWHACARQKGLRAALMLAAGTFFFWNCAFQYFHALDAHFSSERLIESLTSERKPFRPEAPFFSVEHFDPSVPFYLGRTVTLVAVRGELSPGLDAEPDKGIPTIEQFVSRWEGLSGQGFAVMRPEALARLSAAGVPMREMLRDHRLVVVRRR